MSQNSDVMGRCLGAALIVCGVLSFAGTVAIPIHWDGFAACVETIMRADPSAGQVAIADLFGIEPKTWQLVDTIMLPAELAFATLVTLLFGFLCWRQS
jgi:hypothetical protein